MKKTLMTAATLSLLTFGVGPVAHLAHASQYASQSHVTGQKITEEKAKAIALNTIKGQQKAVVHVHLESDDGHQYYEVLVKADNMCYEVELDAATGNVLEVEKESGHDGYGQVED